MEHFPEEIAPLIHWHINQKMRILKDTNLLFRLNEALPSRKLTKHLLMHSL